MSVQKRRDGALNMSVLIALLVTTLIALQLWLWWPSIHSPHFHNEDTAGITYSADLLLRGGVPLRDTAEMKAPGAFFMLAAWWSVVGRSLESAQALMALWSLLGALGLALSSWWLTRSLISASLTALLWVSLSPYTGSLDINYGAWMITPYLWSIALLLKGVSSSKKERLSLWPWVGAGALMTLAALFKRQAVVLVPLICLGAALSEGSWRARLSRLVASGLSALFAFSPIALWYASRGALSEWLSSYALSESGWRYVQGGGQSALSAGERWVRVGDGLLGLWAYFRAPLTLALLSTVFGVWLTRGSAAARWRHARSALLLWSATLCAFVGASLGWRYFKGYYLQLLPSLLLLATLCVPLLTARLRAWRASPASSSPASSSLSAPLILSLTLALVFSVMTLTHDLQQSSSARKARARALYLPTVEAERVSEWLKHHQREGDELWVWGRWGWPIYFHTALSSPTRYYKSLGVLTTQLTNTWMRAGGRVSFNPNGPWREAIAELKASPPRFIVMAKNEDASGFKALQELLRERYQEVATSELKLARPQHKLFKVYELSAASPLRHTQSDR